MIIRKHLPLYALLLLGQISPALSQAGETPFDAAEHYIAKNQFSEARRALQSELILRPKNIQARYNLAVLMQQLGDDTQAMLLYKENLERQWHLPSLVNLSNTLRKHGDTAQAKQWLEKATRQLRHESPPWYLLAEISEEQGSNTKALAQLQTATRVDPLNGFAWLRRADLLSRLGHHQQAVRYADRGTSLLTSCATCFRKYGEILQRAGKPKASIDALYHSLALEPNDQTRALLIQPLIEIGEQSRSNRIKNSIAATKRYHAQPEH